MFVNLLYIFCGIVFAQDPELELDEVEKNLTVKLFPQNWTANQCEKNAVPEWARPNKPQAPIDDFALQDDTPIHLSIAAFRDGPRCAQTIMLAMKYATNPDRLRFTVLDQYMVEDPLCEDGFDAAVKLLCGDDDEQCRKKRKAQVEFAYLPAENSTGPVTARARIQSLQWSSEQPPDAQDFCVVIDSHMKFNRDWDSQLTGDWANIGNEKGVLTTYVLDHMAAEHRNLNKPVSGRHGARAWDFKLSKHNIPRIRTGATLTPPANMLHYVWCAGFSFGRCHFQQTVPFDPNLHGIFDGEEMHVAFRAFTHGYDFYTNAHQAISHEYTKLSYPKPTAGVNWWYNSWGETQEDDLTYRERSVARLKGLFGLPGGNRTSVSKFFDVGNARAVSEFNRLFKFNPENSSKYAVNEYRSSESEWIPTSNSPQVCYAFKEPQAIWYVKPSHEPAPPIAQCWPWECDHSPDKPLNEHCMEWWMDFGTSLVQLTALTDWWVPFGHAHVHLKAMRPRDRLWTGDSHCIEFVFQSARRFSKWVGRKWRKLRFKVRRFFRTGLLGGKSPPITSIAVGLTSETQGAVLDMALKTWLRKFPNSLVAVTDERDRVDGTVRKAASVSGIEYNLLSVASYDRKEWVHGNIFALLYHLPRMYSQSDWFFIGTDETVVAANSLHDYASGLNPQQQVMKGKCVEMAQEQGKPRIRFAVGGSGILLSSALVMAMQPFLNSCREKYAGLYYADAKLGACVKQDMNLTLSYCAHKDGVSFNNQFAYDFPERREIQGDKKDAVVVAVQEPIPEKILELSEFFASFDGSQQLLTWQTVIDHWK